MASKQSQNPKCRRRILADAEYIEMTLKQSKPNYPSISTLVLVENKLEGVAAWEVQFKKKTKTEQKNPFWPPPEPLVPHEWHPKKPIEKPCFWHYGKPSLDGKPREYKLFD